MSAAAPAAKRSLRGAAVCVALFAFGGAVLWGLFLAPRAHSPKAPDVPWRVPARPVRFASFDAFGGPVSDALAKQVLELEPDYVLVQAIRFEDVLPLAERLGMAGSFHPALFQRPDPRSKDQPGHLVLSKHPLYDAGPIWGDRRTAVGVSAVGVIDGSRFTVDSGVIPNDESLASLRPPISGLPPAVVAVSFIQASAGRTGAASGLLPLVSRTEPMVRGGPPVAVSTIYADGAWAAVKTDLVPVGGEPLILFVELKASHGSGQ